MGACYLQPTQRRAWRCSLTSPHLLLRHTDAQQKALHGLELHFKARACPASKCKLGNQAGIECANTRLIKCIFLVEGWRTNSARFHATRLMFSTYYCIANNPRAPPHWFAVLHRLDTPRTRGSYSIKSACTCATTTVLHSGCITPETP